MIDKRIVVFVLCYVFVVFSPFIFLWISSRSLAFEMEPALFGAYVTASGIFTALVTSSIISRKESLTKYHYLMAIFNLGLFLYALNAVFVKQLILGPKLTLLDLAFVLTSVNANALLAILVAGRLLWHKLID